MKLFLILGSGRQGGAVAAFLLEQFADTRVTFVDLSEERLAATAGLQRDCNRVSTQRLDVVPVGDSLLALMADAACVVSCVPYSLNSELAAAAVRAKTCFCDLGGNIGAVAAELELDSACKAAGVAIIPDCGLAPGLLNILAEYWSADWQYKSVRLYCGGLPQNPRGTLKYALTFNVCGLLNEYLDDCQVSRDGEVQTIPGMTEVERLTDLALPGEFEAFATSGGASLAPQLYAPKGVDYQYKTIRHSGHADVINAMWEMGFFDDRPQPFRIEDRAVELSPRDLSAQLMERQLHSDGKDLVLARADVRGTRDGREVAGRIDLLDYAVDRFTAMERTTGFPTAIVAAALAGLYENSPVAPGAHVPFQVIDPRLVIAELERAGVTGISVKQW